MNQKLMKTLGVIIAGFVAFILLLFIIASCSKTKYTYDKLENEMLNIAINYYKNNEKELPSQDKDTKSYTLKKMVSDNKIKDPTKLFDNADIKCDGNVTVINNNGHYLYKPYLTCGKDYHTTYLKDKIIENSLVESGSGLYEDKDQYIFKGDVKNNYIKFDDKLFRIIRINDDNTIRLIAVNGLSEVKWDGKYNVNIHEARGINDYVVAENLYSNIKTVSDNYYNNKKVWSDQARNYITTQTLCIGKRSKKDTSKNGETECSQKLENQLFGSLAVYEYLQASLDVNCNSTSSSACTNYNWFTSISEAFWTITADTDATDSVYSVYKKPTTVICSSYNYLNVVFNINGDIKYISGNGTKKDPYVFK